MAPSRRKSVSKSNAAAAPRRQWKVGDLVLAKVKGFPAWPATVSEPEKWGYSTDWKKVLVYFFGTKQIGFCNPADVEEFTEDKKVALLGKRLGRGADFVRAVQEIADCYDKLKEKSRIGQLSFGDAPAENAVDELTTVNLTMPDVERDLTLKSSKFSRSKDELSLAVEDVGALTEVESIRQGGVSEEPADYAGAPILAMPNTYTLRKKARSHQPQRCTSQKKGSVQMSSSSMFDSHELQNDVANYNGGINGFWEGPLRKAKRSKRSPEDSVPDVWDLPVCNSNGTLDDNGSGVARADSESLSNNEGDAIESKHTSDQLEVANCSCEGSLELSRRLDLQAKSAIVRKKRNQGRKRVQIDGLGSTSRSDGEVNKDIGIRQDTLTLPTSFGYTLGNQPKDEGDEHLPLVKRARVRMGKLLFEEQHQFDFFVKSREKSSESVSISIAREDPDLICNYIQPEKYVLTLNEPILPSPIGNCRHEPESKLQPQETYSSIVNEPMVCSPSDNCVQAPEDKPRIWKAKTIQGCTFDGESALPPSKRLHRALEAMSVNAAEETQISLEENSSTKTENKKSHLTPTELCTNMAVEDEPPNNLDSQIDLLNCNTASHVEVSNICSPFTCEVIVSASGDVNMSDFSKKDLDSVACLEDISLEVALSTDNKDYRVSDTVGTCAPQHQSLQATLTSVGESMPMLESLTTILIEPPPEEFGKAGEYDINAGKVENNNSVTMLHFEEGTDMVSLKATVNNGCCDDTAIILCGAANIPSASVDGNDEASCLGETGEDVKYTATNVNAEPPPSSLNDSSPHRTCHGASVSGSPTPDQIGTNASLDGVYVHKHVSHSNDLPTASNNNDYPRPLLDHAVDAKLQHNMLVSDVGEINCLDTFVCHQTKSRERTNLAEVKAALASLELTLGSLSRTKESIGRATRIAVDCVKFGVAAEVVEVLVLYLEKESSLHRRVDLFFLVDSIAQCCRTLKGEVGGTYISAVKETLARILSVAAPVGIDARDNRRQCLKVLRLWLERRILPESIIRQHIRELDSLNCSTSGHSRRTSRTERPFDDPLREMQGILLDEYGSNSSFQFPEFCMPRMLKEEEEEGSDSDGGSFEAVTPEHDSKIQDTHETIALPAVDKHRHILEDVDGELEMEDVAPSGEMEIDTIFTISGFDVAANMHHSQNQLTSFVPPLPHDVPPQAPPLPTPPQPPPPPPLPFAPHTAGVPFDADSHLHSGRNGIQEAMSSQPPASGVHHSMKAPASTSYNLYPMMHNHVAPGNNLQPMDANLYDNKAYNPRLPYPSPSNHFSYHPPDHQFQPQWQVPLPLHYDRNCFGQSADRHFYGDQDSFRPPRPELTENWGSPRPELTDNWGLTRPELTENWGPQRPKMTENWGLPRPEFTENWGYSRPPYHHSCTGLSCEPIRPQNHGWAYTPHPVHPQNHIPSRLPCDGGAPAGVRAPAYWRPR